MRLSNNIYRGEIYYIDNEKWKDTPYGDGKGRPAIVVSSDEFNNAPDNPFVVVVSLTTKVKDFNKIGCHATIMCRTESTALCEAIKYVDKNRVGDFIRQLSDEEMASIDECMAYVLGMPEAKVVEKETDESAFYRRAYESLLDKVVKNGGRA